MLPLFKSCFSIGRSILTLDDPKKIDLEGADSIFCILKENNLKHLILVEDSLIGFFEAYKRSKEFGIQLIFGLRLSMRNSNLPEDENSEHKVIIFAKNDGGCKKLNKIYSKAFCDYDGFLDYSALKDLWNDEELKLAIPFYDSFIYVNNFSFANAIPDFSFAKPTFFIEDNNLAIDQFIKIKILDFIKDSAYETELVKSIYYKNNQDVKAFMAYKIICNRSFGKDRSLEKPELNHFCSDQFSFESWKNHINYGNSKN